MDLKYILIESSLRDKTEQSILDALYQILDENGFKSHNNLYLDYIKTYLRDYKTNNESFCYSKKNGGGGMNTGYLIDNLENTRRYSSIVIMDDDPSTGDILGVLVFKYVKWSDEDDYYDNSLYIDSFCTNQQLLHIRGIGKLLITSLIEATEKLGYIDNIFLNAATRASEGFYERFNFEATGRVNDKMKEYIYPIYPEATSEEEAEAREATSEEEAQAREAQAREAQAREAQAREREESEESESTGPDSEIDEAKKATKKAAREATKAEANVGVKVESEEDEEPPASMPLSQLIMPRSVPLPHKKVKTPKQTYIKIWMRGTNLRAAKNRLEELQKIFGSDFDFTVKGGKRTIKKRTNKKKTNKKRTNKKRTNKKRTNKKRTSKKKTRKN